MTNVTAELVKTLRDKTGIGMSKCKDALQQAKGNLDEAIKILRKAGLVSAVNKQGRETREGMIAYTETSEGIALVEVNSETDFVVENEKFQHFSQEISQQIGTAKIDDLDQFLAQPSKKDPSLTVDQYRALLVQSLGENIKIRRLHWMPKAPGLSFGVYSHMSGKIVAIVIIEGEGNQSTLARDIAMHVAAEAPSFLNPDQVPENIKKIEEEVAASQLKGKSQEMIDKILVGKMRAFYETVCLGLQKFVKDPSLSIDEFIKQEGKRIGTNLQIRQFLRWKVGE